MNEVSLTFLGQHLPRPVRWITKACYRPVSILFENDRAWTRAPSFPEWRTNQLFPPAMENDVYRAASWSWQHSSAVNSNCTFVGKCRMKYLRKTIKTMQDLSERTPMKVSRNFSWIFSQDFLHYDSLCANAKLTKFWVIYLTNFGTQIKFASFWRKRTELKFLVA